MLMKGSQPLKNCNSIHVRELQAKREGKKEKKKKETCIKKKQFTSIK